MAWMCDRCNEMDSRIHKLETKLSHAKSNHEFWRHRCMERESELIEANQAKRALETKNAKLRQVAGKYATRKYTPDLWELLNSEGEVGNE